MAHYKYTYRNGKRYGPYIYENKRIGDKVVTRYVGKSESHLDFYNIFLLVFAVFLVFGALGITNLRITGYPILGVSSFYSANGTCLNCTINGTIELSNVHSNNTDINLISYWQFTSDARDNKGIYNLSVNGAAKEHERYLFDGVNDYLNVSCSFECLGTPDNTACSQFESAESCDAYGSHGGECSSTYSCNGEVNTDCGVYGDEGSCLANSGGESGGHFGGCSWYDRYRDPSCGGGTLECNAGNENSCMFVGGCSWDYSCLGTHNTCDNYADDMSCEEHDCSWEDTSYCGGTSNPCSTYGEEDCENYAGCNWDAGEIACLGQPSSCDSFENQTSCDGYAGGCSWVMQESCTGEPHSCSIFSEGDCDVHGEGCSWGGSCSGNATTSCESLGEGDCSNYGCSWDGGGQETGCEGEAATPSCGVFTDSESCGYENGCAWEWGCSNLTSELTCGNQTQSLGCSLLSGCSVNFTGGFPIYGGMNWSILSWVKTNSSSGNIFSVGDTNSSSLSISSGQGNIQTAYLFDGNLNYLNSSVKINDSLWHHVGMVYSSGNLKLYVDGILNGSALVDDLDVACSAVTIGHRPSSPFNFSGRIDEVKIYNKSLNSSDVLTVFSSGLFSNAGNYTSVFYDLGDVKHIINASWGISDNVAGNITLQVRAATNPDSNATYTVWKNLTNNTYSSISGLSGSILYRYVQFKALFSSPNGTSTPILSSVTIGYLNNDTTSPLVSILSPLNGSNYSSPVSFNVSLDENGYVKMSLNNGITNYTLSSIDGLNFNYTNSSIAVGNYLVRFYANDTLGNKNYTEFSNFSVGNLTSTPETPETPSGGGSNTGGGGGGGYIVVNTTKTTTVVSEANYNPSEEQIDVGYSQVMKRNESMRFLLKDNYHYLVLNSLDGETVSITVTSFPIKFDLNLGGKRNVDVDFDTIDDVIVEFLSIKDGNAEIYIKKITEQRVSQPENKTEGGFKPISMILNLGKNVDIKVIIALAVGILILLFAIYRVLRRRMLEKRWESVRPEFKWRPVGEVRTGLIDIKDFGDNKAGQNNVDNDNLGSSSTNNSEDVNKGLV